MFTANYLPEKIYREKLQLILMVLLLCAALQYQDLMDILK